MGKYAAYLDFSITICYSVSRVLAAKNVDNLDYFSGK